MLSEISRRLLEWYAQNARRLPWRGRTDFYGVWVSEVMLQQTQVETVIPYYLRWMEQFPTLASLALAPEQGILKAWEGLGYYSRARNLHRAAQAVFAGSLPTTRRELEKLPGIGRYIAAAVASIAFNQDEAALDGNIRRVFARVYGVRAPVRSREAEILLEGYALQNLPEGRAGDYNQALMDLGATVCTPRAPRCLICPLAEMCLARSEGIQDQIPVMAIRPVVPHYVVTAAVLRRDGRVFIAQRPAKGLLGSLWEFPGGKIEAGETLGACLEREMREELGVEVVVGDEFGVYRHAYTHFKVTLHAFLCQLRLGEPKALEAAAIIWVLVDELSGYPMGKIDRLIAARLVKESESLV